MVGLMLGDFPTKLALMDGYSPYVMRFMLAEEWIYTRLYDYKYIHKCDFPKKKRDYHL